MLTIILLFGPTLKAYSPEEGNVTATLGYNWFKTHFDDSGRAPPSPFDGGLGLVATGDISRKGALEIGIFQMAKRFFRKDENLYVGESTELIHISMGYRWWLTEKYSTSLSFYSSYTVGSVHTFRNDFPSDRDMKTSAHDITEYGFDLAAQSEIWKNGLYSAIVEGRYSISVTKKPGEASDHYGLFLGLRYLLKEKDQRPQSKKVKSKP